MKKILIMAICLLSFTATADDKINLRQESEDLTNILNISKPSQKIGRYNMPAIYNLEKNKDVYDDLTSFSGNSLYFNNVLDAFLVTAYSGNPDLKCFVNNISSNTRQLISDTYKTLVDEGAFKMSGSAAVGIYQTMRIICDLEITVKKSVTGLTQGISQELKNKYTD